ncbi:MAG: DUF4037 domain-containing protein [Clostridia bacterium]|nr:DUF4037 domain-containing protein [Clostridia bacterium]
MNALETSRSYFETFGRPMLERDFPQVLPYLAAGLFGSGSECFGFDDAVSADHDVEPGFCLFLPGEDVVDRRTAFLLERAYARLPKEYMGLRRSLLAPVGGPRRGVLRTAEFFTDTVGAPDGALTLQQWLTVPQHSLAEATNGAVFFDNFGEVTCIRDRLQTYPEPVRQKKLAGHLLLMAQAGQYNYRRCLLHGEEAAAQLAVFEFVKHAAAVIFLLNRRYAPYYKWSFRALRALPELSLEAEIFEYLLTTGNDNALAEEKYDAIEGVCADVIDALRAQNLTDAICGDLEKHAYSVNDHITDAELRNLHILATI